MRTGRPPAWVSWRPWRVADGARCCTCYGSGARPRATTRGNRGAAGRDDGKAAEGVGQGAGVVAPGGAVTGRDAACRPRGDLGAAGHGAVFGCATCQALAGDAVVVLVEVVGV